MSLLLANIRTLACFFLFFLVISINYLTIPVAREKNKIKLALAITAGAPITLENEIIDSTPLVALDTIKILSV